VTGHAIGDVNVTMSVMGELEDATGAKVRFAVCNHPDIAKAAGQDLKRREPTKWHNRCTHLHVRSVSVSHSTK
jgi:hypothetical protein